MGANVKEVGSQYGYLINCKDVSRRLTLIQLIFLDGI